MISREGAYRATRKASEVSEAMEINARLGAGYTRVDPIDIAEKAGIFVIARPLDNLLGAFIREERAGIVLNTERSAGMFHLTCAHELGHFYLGHGSTTDIEAEFGTLESEMELEADQFAYSLMSPSKIVTNIMRGQGWSWESVTQPQNLYQLSLRLGLSYKATVWSLVRLKKLDSDTARRLTNVPPIDIKRALVPQGTRLGRTQDVWILGPRDKDFILEPRPTDHMIIDLPSHATAGYLWSVDDAESVGYTLRPVFIESSRPRLQESSSEPRLIVGGQETLRFQLEVRTPVRPLNSETPTRVDFRETQPWATERAGEAEFSLQTKVEVIEPGLSKASRDRHLNEMVAG